MTTTTPGRTDSGGSTAYVLVHGAWHGPWCWEPVAELLRDVGALVQAPTLAGLGSESHLPSEGIDLDRHVRDVLNAIPAQWLGPKTRLVLVGHSYGGMIVTQVAAQLGGGVDAVLVLDGFLPLAGESALDQLTEGLRAHYERWIGESGGVAIAPRPLAKLGVTDPAIIARAQPRLTPQPAATFTQAAHFGATAVSCPGHYLLCTGWPTNFSAQAVRARDLGWHAGELVADHEVMLTDPPLLAAALAAI